MLRTSWINSSWLELFSRGKDRWVSGLESKVVSIPNILLESSSEIFEWGHLIPCSLEIITTFSTCLRYSRVFRLRGKLRRKENIKMFK
jgi:hypothetical protein